MSEEEITLLEEAQFTWGTAECVSSITQQIEFVHQVQNFKLSFSFSFNVLQFFPLNIFFLWEKNQQTMFELAKSPREEQSWTKVSITHRRYFIVHHFEKSRWIICLTNYQLAEEPCRTTNASNVIRIHPTWPISMIMVPGWSFCGGKWICRELGR